MLNVQVVEATSVCMKRRIQRKIAKPQKCKRKQRKTKKQAQAYA